MKASGLRTPKKRFCLGDSCHLQGTIKGYCRMHYISHWREIRDKKNQRAEKRLDDFVNRLAEKYPKDYLQKIKEGLEDEDKFTKTVQEVEAEPDKENIETEREFLERFERKIKIE